VVTPQLAHTSAGGEDDLTLTRPASHGTLAVLAKPPSNFRRPR